MHRQQELMNENGKIHEQRKILKKQNRPKKKKKTFKSSKINLQNNPLFFLVL